jgi:hypothetical protein
MGLIFGGPGGNVSTLDSAAPASATLLDAVAAMHDSKYHCQKEYEV